ncbi:hypothetical protein N3K66_001813 [Trichothecium roseum]|uniref:Uncharacterized protein n=1 Tax=Trichothecium roseum TaxID=47278 RepID=A0ACC0V7U6_9HYPO|nr:hypothetical protein N3K66_001813 [Trichothecium roseum]
MPQPSQQGTSLGSKSTNSQASSSDKASLFKDNASMLQLQRDEMRGQDEQVDQLAAIIRRQKEMGLKINEEVEEQTAMLKMMDEDADRVQGKLKVGNQWMKKF